RSLAQGIGRFAQGSPVKRRFHARARSLEQRRKDRRGNSRPDFRFARNLRSPKDHSAKNEWTQYVMLKRTVICASLFSVAISGCDNKETGYVQLKVAPPNAVSAI